MDTVRKKDAHIWGRDPHDWYVEPPECSLALFQMECFDGPIWDPACGLGRIVQSARESGLSAFGTDLVRRSEYCEHDADFFKFNPPKKYSHIVSNPPFGRAEEFVLECLERVGAGGKVAMLLPLVWLSGFSSKRSWLPTSPLATVYPISPRPSMPPGKVILEGIRPGNGTKDFAWFVWESGRKSPPQIVFMNTKQVVAAHRRRRPVAAVGGKNEQGTFMWD